MKDIPAAAGVVMRGMDVMAIELNHTIVPAHDKVASAKFFAKDKKQGHSPFRLASSARGVSFRERGCKRAF